jgi:dienelactone hydrolase
MGGNPQIAAPARRIACAMALFVAATPCLAQESVRFPSLDGDLTGGAPTEIEAKLYRPEGEGPFAAIVAMHGCGGRDWRDGRPTSLYRAWTERLVGLGFVVLLTDSFKPRGIDEVCTKRPQPVTQILHRPRDAYGALAWLAVQPYVRADRVILMGWSHGGGTVLATLDSGRRAVPRPVNGAQFRAAIAFYPGCRTAQGRSDWRTSVPLLILNGEADDWTPVEPCRQLLDRVGPQGQPVELKTYPGAFHSFDAPSGQLRQRSDVGSRPGGTVTLGPDPAARADAYERVAAFLSRHAGP